MNKNKDKDENELQVFCFIYIIESIKNSENELTTSKLASLYHSEREQQSLKHYEDSLMILFCVVKLIAKITSKQEVNESKSTIYKKVVTASDADQ